MLTSEQFHVLFCSTKQIFTECQSFTESGRSVCLVQAKWEQGLHLYLPYGQESQSFYTTDQLSKWQNDSHSMALMDKLFAKDGRLSSEGNKEAIGKVFVVGPEAGIKGMRDVDMVIE